MQASNHCIADLASMILNDRYLVSLIGWMVSWLVRLVQLVRPVLELSHSAISTCALQFLFYSLIMGTQQIWVIHSSEVTHIPLLYSHYTIIQLKTSFIVTQQHFRSLWRGFSTYIVRSNRSAIPDLNMGPNVESKKWGESQNGYHGLMKADARNAMRSNDPPRKTTRNKKRL